MGDVLPCTHEFGRQSGAHCTAAQRTGTECATTPDRTASPRLLVNIDGSDKRPVPSPPHFTTAHVRPHVRSVGWRMCSGTAGAVRSGACACKCTWRAPYGEGFRLTRRPPTRKCALGRKNYQLAGDVMTLPGCFPIITLQRLQIRKCGLHQSTGNYILHQNGFRTIFTTVYL